MANEVNRHLVQDLLRIHKVVTRGLAVARERGAVFLRDGFPAAGARRGYLDYVRALAVILSAHHDGEDTIVFPMMRTRVPEAPYDKLDADHRDIVTSLNAVRSCLDAADAGQDPAAWLTRLLGVLDAVETLWRTHIATEESHFTPQVVDRALTPAEQVDFARTLGDHGRRAASPPQLCVPFLLFNLDPAERALMEEKLPFVVKRVLVPIVWKANWADMKPLLLA